MSMGIEGDYACLRAIEEEGVVFPRDLRENPVNNAMLVGWSLPLSMLQKARWHALRPSMIRGRVGSSVSANTRRCLVGSGGFRSIDRRG
jgi:hypothetical protein